MWIEVHLMEFCDLWGFSIQLVYVGIRTESQAAVSNQDPNQKCAIFCQTNLEFPGLKTTVSTSDSIYGDGLAQWEPDYRWRLVRRAF